MILLNAIYFVPAFASLLWIVLLCFKQKNQTQKQLLLLLIFCTYYYISYALYISPWTDYQLMACFDVLNLPISMMILALNIEFVLLHHTSRFYKSKWHWLIYLPVAFFLVASIVLYNQVGIARVAYCEELKDNGIPIPVEYLTDSYRIHHHVTHTLFNSMAFVAILFTVGICYRVLRVHGYRWGDVYRFFFKGADTLTIRALCVMDAVTISSMIPITLVGRMWMLHHPVISVTLSLLTAFLFFCLCYVEYYIDLRRCTLYQLSHLELHHPLAVPPASHAAEETSPGESFAEEVFVENPNIEIPEGLPRMIHRAFEVELVYRDPDLSIITLSDRLGTNRTTLSATINQTFGIPFRQLVNNYRVEAAKSFMLTHPKATQDAIAVECGFTSAQAFNLKFKAATGLAPRAWLLANLPESD